MNVEIVLPEPHEKQLEILHGAKRFNHIQCGRRFGKTELIKELSTVVLDGCPLGIFCPIERDFLKTWEALKELYRPIKKKEDNTYHILELITGGVIHMWSMKAVDNGRGEAYKRVILDEFAKAAYGRKSWEETIRATLADYQGDAWFLSTPKGKLNYFYDLKEKNYGKENWAFWKFTSYNNPYIPVEEIEEAKNDLDEISFAQEYLAEDVDRNEQPFLYSFDEKKHVGKGWELDKSLPLWLSFDFNVTPMTVNVAQRTDKDTLKIRKLIKLNNASTYHTCDRIKVLFQGFYYIVTGDATGSSRGGRSRENLTHWQIIVKELKLKNPQIKIRSQNLDHNTSQIICNSALEHKNIIIHKECSELIEDCRFAATDEHGKLIKTPDKGMHFLDGFRYLIDINFMDILKHK